MRSEDFATLTLERVGHVLRVTIDHPSSALNAVDERLHHDLTALCAGLRRETEARAVVLTGRGRAFSAGGDFAWFDTSTALELLTFHSEDHREALAALREKPPPVFKGR